MKKILIIGCSGSGKSTFSKQLGKKLNINVIHLDQHYWKPDWVKTGSEEWEEKVKELLSGEEWIMDGNYRSTMDIRVPYADTIIWLDCLPLVCLYRVFKRRFQNRRVDVFNGCKDRVSYELVRWILWKFPRENRKDIVQRFENLKGKKRIFILKSNEDVKKFLSDVR